MTQIRRMRPGLGTFVEIGLVAETQASQTLINNAFTRAFERIALIEELLSFHSPTSDLTRLNRAQGQATLCHPLSVRCIRLARAMTRATNGLFNCTLGAALIQHTALPAHDFTALYGAQLLAAGTADDISIRGHYITLNRPVLLTLDGIAKGFAVDSALAQLKAAGIKAGWINAGGDVRVFGDLTIPINVRDHLGNEHSMGGLNSAAVATSTTSASAEFPGLILNQHAEHLAPATWTLLAHFAWRADALTKVAANLPSHWSHEQLHQALATWGGRWVAIG